FSSLPSLQKSPLILCDFRSSSLLNFVGLGALNRSWESPFLIRKLS
ncbi:hypothetical protein LINGRAPRIM_LOCUS210, partial [Linum grandiflorum]